MSISKDILEDIKSGFPEHHISNMVTVDPYIDSTAVERELKKIIKAESSTDTDKTKAKEILLKLEKTPG
jgi:hypothetical protein